jgi:integrase
MRKNHLLEDICDFLAYIGKESQKLTQKIQFEIGKQDAELDEKRIFATAIIKYVTQHKKPSVRANAPPSTLPFIPKKDNYISIEKEIIKNAKDYGLMVVSGGETLPPKLKYGQGTVCKRTRQNKHGTYSYWQGRFMENGQQKTVTAKTLKECLARMNIKKSVNEIKRPIVNDFMTFAEWLKEWFEKYKVPNLKPSSANRIFTYIEKSIAPNLGNIKLNELTTLTIQEFLIGINKSNTRQKIYNIVKGSLQKAYETQIIKFNPALAVEIKAHRPAKKRAYEFNEQELMLQVLTPKYKALFYFLCCTGLRIGEFLALTEDDIDDMNHIINVSKSLDITTGSIGTTKTGKKRKVLYLDELFEGIKQIIGEKKFFGEYSYDGIKKAFTTAIRRLELKDVFIHSTRHTFSSVCYYVGIQDKQIQEWLGHSTMAMTVDTYTHLMGNGESLIKNYIQKLKDKIKTVH